jgi:hypothetical protein
MDQCEKLKSKRRSIMKKCHKKTNVCLFVYFLNENKSTILTTNKDEKERKQKDNQNEKKVKDHKTTLP